MVHERSTRPKQPNTAATNNVAFCCCRLRLCPDGRLVPCRVAGSGSYAGAGSAAFLSTAARPHQQVNTAAEDTHVHSSSEVLPLWQQQVVLAVLHSCQQQLNHINRLAVVVWTSTGKDLSCTAAQALLVNHGVELTRQAFLPHWLDATCQLLGCQERSAIDTVAVTAQYLLPVLMSRCLCNNRRWTQIRALPAQEHIRLLVYQGRIQHHN